MTKRAIPFSGKKKKEQLKQRHLRKQASNKEKDSGNDDLHSNEKEVLNFIEDSSKTGRYRYQMCFKKETKAEIDERTCLSRQPFVRKSELEREIGLDQIYPPNLDILLPKRPPWNYSMNKKCIEDNEKKYFDSFVQNLKSQPWWLNISHFEQNLETWRQLWRVLEKSDVITMLADARFPALHFFPPLIDYVTKTLKKPAILVLNKVDIVPPENVIGWKKYFTEIYPNLKVVYFTSFPKTPNTTPSKGFHILSKTPRKKGGFVAYGEKDFLDSCKSLFPDKNFDAWQQKLGINDKVDATTQLPELQSDPQDNDLLLAKWNDDDNKTKFITIGLVGFPNVGKSSFLNGIRGRKVVSVSKTPGHTKYFQTIFITNDIVLCDCPGLIFPSIVDKQWQILSGVFPLSQVREPYTSVGYLAQMTDLVELLQLKHPLDQEKEEWSAWDICTAWAIKRGFLTAKSGRPDAYRAANHLLRLTTIGRIPIFHLPPNFKNNKALFESDTETQELAQSLKKYSNYTRSNCNHQDEEVSTESSNDLNDNKDDKSIQINNRFRQFIINK